MANSYFYHNMVRTYQLPNTGSIESKVRKNEWASKTSISWADLIYPTRISLQIWVPLIFASQFHFSILIAKWNYSFYNTKGPTSDGAMAFGWIHILEEQMQAISGGLTLLFLNESKQIPSCIVLRRQTCLRIKITVFINYTMFCGCPSPQEHLPLKQHERSYKYVNFSIASIAHKHRRRAFLTTVRRPLTVTCYPLLWQRILYWFNLAVL